MSREIIDQWNKWYKKALKRYYLHNAATRWYHQKSVALGFWVVILTTITGTIGGTTILDKFIKSKPNVVSTILLIILGVFSIVTAILTALQKGLGYSEKVQKHKEASSGFENLVMELDRSTACINHEYIDFFNNIKTKWKKISEDAPTLPNFPTRIKNEVLEEYEEEFKSKKEPPLLINCIGSVEDLLISEGNKIISTHGDRKWSYEVEDAIVRISTTEITFSYTVNVKRPGNAKIETYDCEGKGLIDSGIAYIDYKYTKNDRTISWNGVMVLKILKMAEFKGFWITNILEDGRFAFGNIHLKPEVSQSE